MSYVSHATHEFQFAGLPTEVEKLIMSALELLSDEGHSGGSIGFFIGWVNRWREDLSVNPEYVPSTDSMLYPYWELIRDEQLGTKLLFLDTLAKVAGFKPLTLLTGADEEWGEYNHGSYQNRRCSNIFKDADGRAYTIDGRVFYTPSVSWEQFNGYTNRSSRKFITFPYDGSTEPERIYYTDESRNLSFTDPNAAKEWLRIMRMKYHQGINPVTTVVKRDVVLGDYSDWCSHLKEFVELLRSQDISFKEHRQKWEERIYRHEDMDYDGKPFASQITTVLYRTRRLFGLLPDGAVLREYNGTDKATFDLPDGTVRHLSVVDVKTHDRRYQEWRTVNNQCTVVSSPYDAAEPYFVQRQGKDLLELNIFDADKYLFSHRRERGYQHPKSKITVASTLAEVITRGNDASPTDPVPEPN